MKYLLLTMVAFVLVLSGCSPNDTSKPDLNTVTPIVETPVTPVTPEATDEISGEQENIVEIAKIVQSMELTNTRHSVKGVVNIYDNNTIEIEGFAYDGKGPDVYIALGEFSEKGTFTSTFFASEKLVRSYDNEKITLNLPTDFTIDQLNAVSVWCDNFADDFGSAVFK